MYVLHYLFYMRLIRNSERGEKKIKIVVFFSSYQILSLSKPFSISVCDYMKKLFFFFFPSNELGIFLSFTDILYESTGLFLL